MNKNIQSILIVLVLFMVGGVASAKMTDQQVISYVKTATAQGKSQQQIGKELFTRGVSQEQLERVKKTSENQGPNAKAVSTKKTTDENGSSTLRSVDKRNNLKDSTLIKKFVREDLAELQASSKNECYYVRIDTSSIVNILGIFFSLSVYFFLFV